MDGQSLRTSESFQCRWQVSARSEVWGIVWAMASALDYAYQRGNAHRDIKPGNILLSADWAGRPERLWHRADGQKFAPQMSGLVGTPNYSRRAGTGAGDRPATDTTRWHRDLRNALQRTRSSNDTPFAVVKAHVTRPLRRCAKSGQISLSCRRRDRQSHCVTRSNATIALWNSPRAWKRLLPRCWTRPPLPTTAVVQRALSSSTRAWTAILCAVWGTRRSGRAARCGRCEVPLSTGAGRCPGGYFGDRR